MPLFSIITVCRNTEKTIEKTLKSVLNQTYNDYEYIIVDGASTDDTMSIIDSYRELFSQKGIVYSVCSEKDSGIYNAMNKGVNMSNGEWLLFLNAGDSLCADAVLERFAANVDNEYDIVYGDAIHEFAGMFKYEKSLPLEIMTEKIPFSHQSAFISRNIMKKYYYDESYKIAADFDFFLRCYKDGVKFKSVSLPVSFFELGGISSSGNILRNIEHIRVLHSNQIIDDSTYEEQYNCINNEKSKFGLKSKIKKILPKWVLLQIRKRNCKKVGFSKENPIAEVFSKQ